MQHSHADKWTDVFSVSCEFINGTVVIFFYYIKTEMLNTYKL